MTAGHFIYIPTVLTIGIVIGFILGGRAARDQLALEKKKEEERAARKAAREAARAKAKKEQEEASAE